MILHIVQADRAQTGLDGVVSMSGVVSHASREQLREFICRGDSAATVGHDAPLLHERLQTFSCSGLGNTKSGGNVVKIGRAIRKQLQNFFQRGTGFGFALSAGNRRPAIGFHRSDDCCDEELWWGKCAAASSSNTVGIPVATASTRRPSFVRRCLYISTNWRLRAEVSSMVPNAPNRDPVQPAGARNPKTLARHSYFSRSPAGPRCQIAGYSRVRDEFSYCENRRPDSIGDLTCSWVRDDGCAAVLADPFHCLVQHWR